MKTLKIVTLIAAMGCCGEARAEFTLSSVTVLIDKSSDVVSFSLTFNQTPDFTATEPGDNHADSFEIDILGTNKVDSYLGIGQQGNPSTDVLVFYDLGKPPVTTVTPTISGETVSFSVPLSLISTQTASQGFNFSEFAADHGGGTAVLSGHAPYPSPVPEPSSLVLSVLGVAVLGVVSRRGSPSA